MSSVPNPSNSRVIGRAAATVPSMCVIDAAELAALLGTTETAVRLSAARVYDHDRLIPKPTKFGRLNRWRLDLVQRWLDEKFCALPPEAPVAVPTASTKKRHKGEA